MHVRLYRPKIVLGTTLQASNTTSTNKPTATTPTAKPWILVFKATTRLYVNATIWTLFSSGTVYLPLCESSWPECWQELLILLVLFLNIYFFNNMSRFFLSFFLFFLPFSFSFNIPQDTFWQSDRSRVQSNFGHLCNTTCKINKLADIYLTACCFGHYLSCYPCFLAI